MQWQAVGTSYKCRITRLNGALFGNYYRVDLGWRMPRLYLVTGHPPARSTSQKLYTKAANCESKESEANNGDDDAGEQRRPETETREKWRECQNIGSVGTTYQNVYQA